MFRLVTLFIVSRILLLAQDPATLLTDPAVKAALAAAQANEPQIISEQVRICQIPAPPFKEELRGREMARIFTRLV